MAKTESEIKLVKVVFLGNYGEFLFREIYEMPVDKANFYLVMGIAKKAEEI